MDSQKRNYAMLGVNPGCSEQEIKKAYIRLAKVYHPDKMKSDAEGPQKHEQTFTKIHNAYQQCIKDTRARQKQHAKNFTDYMAYVNNILDIFHEENSDSEQVIQDLPQQTQQESLEKACHKIMKILPGAFRSDNLKSVRNQNHRRSELSSEGSKPVINTNISADFEGPPTQAYVPSEKQLRRVIRKKKKVFTVIRQNLQ